MGFKLSEVLGQATAPRPVAEEPPVRQQCPGTGKDIFRTKREADAALRRVGGDTPMHRYRCPYCEAFHLGHRRGASKVFP